MICHECYGQGWRTVSSGQVVCEYCNGHGVTHCCEGDQAQPEPTMTELCQETGGEG